MRCWTMRWLSWRLSKRACRRRGVDASQALAKAMGSIQEAQEANKRTQDTNQAWMLNHTLKLLEVPDDLRQVVERGLFCPLELDDPENIPNVGDIKEKYVPYIRRLRGAEPMEPGGTAGGDARPGDTGAFKGAGGTSQCHRRTWTRRRASCPCSSGQ